MEHITLSPGIQAALELAVVALIGVVGTTITLTFRRLNGWLRSKTESEELRSASEELDKFVEDTVRKGSSTLLSEFKLAAKDGKITRAELASIVASMTDEVRVQLGTKGVDSLRKRLGRLEGDALQATIKTRVEAGLNALVDRVTLQGGIQLDLEQDEHTTTQEIQAPEGEGEGE